MLQADKPEENNSDVHSLTEGCYLVILLTNDDITSILLEVKSAWILYRAMHVYHYELEPKVFLFLHYSIIFLSDNLNTVVVTTMMVLGGNEFTIYLELYVIVTAILQVQHY